jgi:chromosome segregation ATPase
MAAIEVAELREERDALTRELNELRRRFTDTEDALMRMNRKLMKAETSNGALLAALVELRDAIPSDCPEIWERAKEAIATATGKGRRQG